MGDWTGWSPAGYQTVDQATDAWDPVTGTWKEGYGPYGPTTVDGSSDNLQGSEPQPTLSDYMKDNPNLSYEDYMKFMAQHSEEWAEKYLDYLTEKGELDRANEYTALREDSAYQRLTQDLLKAGLNPAMMYGGSASISAGGSQGYVKMSEGANSRAVNNYSKIQKVLLAYMMYQLQKELGTANSVFKGIGSLGQLIGAFL